MTYLAFAGGNGSIPIKATGAQSTVTSAIDPPPPAASPIKGFPTRAGTHPVATVTSRRASKKPSGSRSLRPPRMAEMRRKAVISNMVGDDQNGARCGLTVHGTENAKRWHRQSGTRLLIERPLPFFHRQHRYIESFQNMKLAELCAARERVFKVRPPWSNLQSDRLGLDEVNARI